MFGGVEKVANRGGEWGQANAAGGVAEGVLKLAELFGERRFTRARGGGVEGEGVVKHADDDLHPVGFGAAEFLHFEAQGAFLGVVGFLHEVSEGFGFGGHAVADFFRGGDGFSGVGLHGLPEAGGEVDLGGNVFQVLDLRDGGGEAVSFSEFKGEAVFEDERKDGEQRAEGDAGADGCDGKAGKRHFALGMNEPSEAQQEGIAEEEGPFGDGGLRVFAHGAHGLEEGWCQRKRG